MNKLYALPYILLLCAMPYNAYAETAVMPITSKILQCGTRENALLECRFGDDRCCSVAPVMAVEEVPVHEIEPAAGELAPVSQATKFSPEANFDGRYVYHVETDDGVIVNFE